MNEFLQDEVAAGVTVKGRDDKRLAKGRQVAMQVTDDKHVLRPPG